MFKGIFNRSLVKYLFSYCLCLILPVVIFYLAYKFFFLSAYSEQAFAKTTENLENSFSSADAQMNNLNQISSQILTSSQFSDSFFEETPRILTFFAVYEPLRGYRTTNEFIYDIGVFDRKSGYFYSSLNMLSLDHFVRFGPAYPEFDNFPFVETLFAAGDRMWIPETRVNLFNSDYPLLTYISSYSNSFTHNNAVLVLLIRKDIFDNALRPVMPSNGSTAAVIDHTGQVIYSFNPSMKNRVENFLGSGGAETPGAGTLKADGIEYFSYVWQSPQGGLTYLSLIPRQELTGAVRNFTTTFFIMILGILFCGSLLIFFLMQSNYKPIQKIVRYSREQGGLLPGGGGQRISDTDLIQLTLENICKNNLSLEDLNKEYLRNGILFCLLKGTAANPAQFQKAGIDTGGVQHTVVIFRLDEDKVIPMDEFGRLLEKNLRPWPFTIYLLDYLEKNNFIGIFICRQEAPHVRDILEKLCLETGKEAGVEIKAAYGDEVRRIEDISHSYFQARMVLRYQIQKSARKTLGFQEMLPEEIPDYLYIRVELNTLEDAIGTKNSSKVNFIISELIDTVKHEHTSYFFAVCLCYDIINIFIKEIYKTRNILALDIIKKYQRLFLENFDHPVENLITIVASMSQETMQAVDLNAGVSANRNSILTYIEDHYRESDFCVQAVADHFGMSISNLSHQFKSYTGENIASRISTLRIHYAKELLTLTRAPVQEIAGQLGYFQTSSFIKKFKTMEGMTPGEYRVKRQTTEEERHEN
jgi:AraC-like DNA-binding protein